ncbi:MAG: carbohydrate kinase, partial [Clostridia bacterium]|nr:carbohydrate kinase [Clostridia bacterium]
FNLKLETGKREMIRAVLEGICFHLRWLLECESAKVRTSDTVRFVGGGALSPVTCQMLADITGRVIETIDEPQNAGTVGAALLIALGMKIIDSPEAAGRLIPVKAVYRPNAANKAVYERNYQVFCKLYRSNAGHFKALNESSAGKAPKLG